MDFDNLLGRKAEILRPKLYFYTVPFMFLGLKTLATTFICFGNRINESSNT